MAKIQLVIEIEERLYKNIIDNDKDDEEFEAMDDAFNNAKPLPKDATNGDVIKAMFSDVEIEERKNAIYMKDTNGVISSFGDTDWWNTPYKTDKEG